MALGDGDDARRGQKEGSDDKSLIHIWFGCRSAHWKAVEKAEYRAIIFFFGEKGKVLSEIIDELNKAYGD